MRSLFAKLQMPESTAGTNASNQSRKRGTRSGFSIRMRVSKVGTTARISDDKEAAERPETIKIQNSRALVARGRVCRVQRRRLGVAPPIVRKSVIGFCFGIKETSCRRLIRNLVNSFVAFYFASNRKSIYNVCNKSFGYFFLYINLLLTYIEEVSFCSG